MVVGLGVLRVQGDGLVEIGHGLLVVLQCFLHGPAEEEGGSALAIPCDCLSRKGERLIGLPVGQAFSLSDQLPNVPVPDLTVEQALEAGATESELVEVLITVAPAAGLARVVAAAPRLATALGYDIEADE